MGTSELAEWAGILAQFGGVVILTMACSEFFTIPIGRPGGTDILSRKRINAIFYAVVISLVGWMVNLIHLPETAVPEPDLWLRLMVVVALALIAVGLAHSVHSIWNWRKEK